MNETKIIVTHLHPSSMLDKNEKEKILLKNNVEK